MAKLKLLVAFGIGYVAGSAAGRQRYEQIRSGAQKVASDPRVQSAAQRVSDTVAEKGPVVAEAVKDRTVAAASAVADKVSSSDAHADAHSEVHTDEPSTPEPPRGGAPIS